MQSFMRKSLSILNHYVNHKIPMIESHRGITQEEPENTLASFARAIELNCHSIECDIWLTKDNIPVVIHDNDISLTLNGTGNVKELTYEELAKYSSNKNSIHSPPTLEKLLQLCKDRIFINIELKDKDYMDCLRHSLDLINKYDMRKQVAFSSFSFDYYHNLKALDQDIEFGFLFDTTEGQELRIDYSICEKGKGSINIWQKHITKELVDEIHANGLGVQCWFCMKDEEDDGVYHRLVASGVDVICCNRPKDLQRFIEVNNKKLTDYNI